MAEKDTHSHLASLPVEILLKVFSLLSYRDRIQLKCTCRRLYDISGDPHLWREIVWNQYSPLDAPQLRGVLVHNSSVITKLEVNGEFQLAEFSSQLTLCHSIKVLVLGGSLCSFPDLESIIKSLPSLVHLECEPCNTPCKMERCNHRMCRQVEWRDFFVAAASLSSLTIVNLWNEYFVDFILREWCSKRYYPVELNVRFFAASTSAFEWKSRCEALLDTWKESQRAFPRPTHVARFSLYSHQPRASLQNPPLFELSLGNAPLSTAVCVAMVDSVDDVGGVIRLSGRSLSSGEFSTGLFMPEARFHLSPAEASFKGFASVSRSLTYLSFSGCISLRSLHLQLVADLCPQLSQLNLVGCILSLDPLFGLVAIASKCRTLRALNIRGISSASVENVPELWRILSQVRRLSHLVTDLCLLQPLRSSIGGAKATFHLDDSEIEAISASLTRMSSVVSLEVGVQRQMECQACNRTDPHCLEFISNLTSLKQLRLLHLPPKPCAAITDAILSDCVHLKVLYVAVNFAFEVSEEALSSSNLHKLYIRCDRMNIRDSVIDPLLCSNKLTHLYLFVRSISKSSILKILQNFPHLQSCHIYCRDRAVMFPPSATLEFRRMIQQLAESRAHMPPLDFLLEEDTMSFDWVDFSTTRSIISSEVLSACIWN